MHGTCHVPAGRCLANDTDVCAPSSEGCDTLSEGVGHSRTSGQIEAGLRISGSQDFNRAPEPASFVSQRNDRDPQGQRTPVNRVIDGGEVLNPLEPRFECKGQGTGIFAVDPASRELAPPTDSLPVLIAQQSSSSVIHMLKGALMIEDDNRFAELIEDLDPCPPNEIFFVLGHASITARMAGLFAISLVGTTRISARSRNPPQPRARDQRNTARCAQWAAA